MLCIAIFGISLILMRFSILSLIRSHDSGRPMTDEQKRTKNCGISKENEVHNNSSNLVEEVTPQILFLDTKPFVIFTDKLFQVDAYFKKSG